MADLSDRASRRNAVLIALDYVGYGVGVTFLGMTTILPSLVRTLGGRPVVVGSLSAIMTGGWLLPQLFAGQALAHRAQVKGYVWIWAAISRAGLALFVPVLWLFAVQAPRLTLVALLVSLAVFSVGDALSSVGWFDLLAKAVPLEWRGRMMGAAQSTASLLGIGAGAVVQAILAQPRPFPGNQVRLFLLGAITCGLSLVFIGLVREPVGVAQELEQKRLSWGAYLPRLRAIVRTDARFVWLTVVRWLSGLADMASAFYILYAADRLHLPMQMSGLFISASVVGGLLSGVVLGPVADRRGSAFMINIVMLLHCACPPLALLAPFVAGFHPWVAPGLFALIFGVMGMFMGAYMVGPMNYLLEIAPAGERSLYVALSNTLGGLQVLSPLLAGWLLEVTSYEVLFLVTLGLGLLGLAVALRGPSGLARWLPGH